MSKLVSYVIVLILAVFVRITISDDSSSSYYSWNYGGVSSNDGAASSRGYESPASEENQYDTPPGSEGDSTNTYFESQYAYPPNAGADNSSAADDVTYASPPDMSSAPSSLEPAPNNSYETYKDELSSSSSYDNSSTPQSESSSYSSYNDSLTPQSDSSSYSSYNDSLTPQSDSSSSSSNDNSSTAKSDSSSSSSTREEDSSQTTTDESKSGTEERYNSVEDLGSGVDGIEMKTEHSGSKAGLVFGVLIGVCAVGAAGFIYIKKKRESHPNTNKYISLTRWDRI